MRKFSIKTVDGSRYDLPPGVGYQTTLSSQNIPYIYFEIDGVERYINANHIVCITKKEVDNA